MKAYINELIVTVVVCRLVTMAAPEGEMRRRYLSAVCALVTLMTLISPIIHAVSGAEEAVSRFIGELTPAEADEKPDELETAAAVIFSYARNRRGFDTDGAEITFYTDENGEVESAAVFFQKGSTEMCRVLREELSAEMGMEVFVYTGEVNEDGDG